MKLQEILNDRGIDRAATEFEWRETDYHGVLGWRYPVYSIRFEWLSSLINPSERILGHRWKAANAEQAALLPEHLRGAKYLWIPAKPKNEEADWYILPPALEAIREAKGTVYIVNGEPALLAMYQAGIQNAITTTLSEISVPPNIITFLQSLSIRKVLYIADKDRAGLQSAAKWRASLIESGIEFQPLELPSGLGQKADVNDLWIECSFNETEFRTLIETLPALVLPQAVQNAVRENYGERVVDNSGIAEAIASYYNLLGTRVNPSNGFYYKSVRCPFHDDHRASAGVHSTKGILHCHVCGSFGYREHASIIGIDLSKYEQAPKNAQDRSINDSEREQYLYEAIEVRQALRDAIRADKRRLIYDDEHPFIQAMIKLLLLRERLEGGFRVYKSEYQEIAQAQNLLLKKEKEVL